MPIDDRFDAIDDATWISFCESWLEELNEDDEIHEVSDRVTYMKFMAHPSHLWKFIRLSTQRASKDNQLAHIAAGLVERLLGKYGEDYIEMIEREAYWSPTFVRLLTGVRKNLMKDEVWQRVRVLQSLSNEKLATIDQHDRVIELENAT